MSLTATMMFPFSSVFLTMKGRQTPSGLKYFPQIPPVCCLLTCEGPSVESQHRPPRGRSPHTSPDPPPAGSRNKPRQPSRPPSLLSQLELHFSLLTSHQRLSTFSSCLPLSCLYLVGQVTFPFVTETAGAVLSLCDLAGRLLQNISYFNNSSPSVLLSDIFA